ncbi:MAG: hypothetical protein GOP50_10945 [Candidatus Heimdallarchaeota archaeon]|nr:hypothetical protein [Candidatus Heimdallarchaeota archaeon]
MSKEEEFQNEELQKIQNYLKDSQKNIERMKKGKKPRRKFRFIVKENKLLFTLISLMLLTGPFFSLIQNQTPPEVVYPYSDAIANTLDTLDSNFTTEAGFPVHETVSENTSSELIILYSLVNSMLIDCDLLAKEEHVLQKISYIFQIIENGTFRDFNEITTKLPVFYQFLGIYTLMQAYYILQNTSYAFTFNLIDNVINSTITDFVRYDIWPYFYTVSEGTNTTILADQSLAVAVLATYMLLTGIQEVFGWDLKEVTESLVDRIESRFYISISKSFYHQYEMDTHIGSGLSTCQDLVFTSFGLSRMEKYSASHTFPISSSSVHQKVINELVDLNWLVHETDRIDSIILIENQAYFSMISYLLNLKNVGVEIQNATATYFYMADGFIADKIDSTITAESCLYGLMTILVSDWGTIQNGREYNSEPRPTPTETGYEPSNSINITIVFLTVLVYTVISRIIVRFRKRKTIGDQAEI